MRRTTPWGRRTTLSLSALFAVAVLALSAHADEKTLNKLQRLDVEEGEKATQIVVRGSSAPTFTVFKLNDPVRLFIDVSNADITGIEGPFEVENGVVSQVSTLQFNDDLVRIGRIIVGLDVDALYSVRAEGSDLVVKIDGSQRKAQRPLVVTKTVVDEAALSAARTRVVDAQARAKAAEGRAEAAEARAQAAAQTAEASTAAAEARAAQAESRARTAEATAQQEAADATQNARVAAQRADAAEARAKAAERDAEAARTAAAASGADTQSAAAAKVKAAEERANEAVQVATAARASAQAAQVAMRAKSTEVEARMAEAQARAAEAEARARKAETEALARGREATSHAQAARAAEARARDANATVAEAEARAKAASDRLTQAEGRTKQAEARASAAEAQATSAIDRATAAEAQANSAIGRAQAAEAQATSAMGRAQAAEARAAQAEAHARDAAAKASSMATAATEAGGRAKAAEKAVVALKSAAASTDVDAAATAKAQLKAAEAEARATAAEARARAAEAEQARLAEKTAAIEAARQDAKAEVERLRAEQSRLNGLLTASRASNNSEKTERLQAEQRAQDAKLTAESARVAQLESARAASNLDQHVADLMAKLAEAKRSDRSAEAADLERQLAGTRGEAETLRSALRSREADLTAARRAAESSRLEAERLKAALAAKAEEAAAAQAKANARATAVPSRAPLRVQHVQFADTGDRTEIQIRVKGNPDYTVRAEGERTRILEFKNALVDPAIERSLDTSDFGGAVQLVSTFQAPPPGDRVRVVVTLAKAIKDTVELSKGRLVWAFAKPKVSAPVMAAAPTPATIPTPLPAAAPLPAAVPPAPVWRAPPPPAALAAPIVPPIASPRAAVFTGMGQSISTNTDSRPRPAKRRRFNGRKINIDIKDGDIHNILRLLAKEGNVNIVTSDEVDGTVTMHLKLVPWDQALDIILRTKGLDMVREGDIIRIAKAESIAKERENELKKIEVKEKLKPLEVKLISVNHADAGDLMPRVKSVLSSRGKSEFDERTNTVILKDVDDHLDAAEDLIRRLDTQTPQVLIETRIVEVNEVNVQELGIQWGFDSVSSVGTGNPTGLRFPSSIGISGGSDDQQTVTEGVSSNPNFVVNLPAAAGNGAGGAIGLTFGSIDSTFNLNVRLSALENMGSVKIISSPKITTLDNKRASISQGVSIPISQISASGVQTIFFDAVLSLEVMPHVTQDGNIYLEIRAENNTPDFQNVGARGDPTILKKEAQTQLLLKDGDTTVIGGIYTSNAGYNRAEVPYLARIPILGAFFRNHRESDRRTELLIFVTPRIVNRAASTVRTAP